MMNSPDNYDSDISTLSPKPIVKLTYKHSYFDVSKMKMGGRTVTTITEDGIIVVKEYKAGSRKVYSSKTTTCSVEGFRELCAQLEDCIETADRWDMFVDDCSEELRLTYRFGREQIVDRGLGNEKTRIGLIMWEFLNTIFDDKTDEN